mmetsp:Transcript_138828/g.442827  ORF Transcript_138828/g.442827 Transcript_138828/m.442827 type:complete len:282 (-) Transcript_138828:1725-2570(-)
MSKSPSSSTCRTLPSWPLQRTTGSSESESKFRLARTRTPSTKGTLASLSTSLRRRTCTSAPPSNVKRAEPACSSTCVNVPRWPLRKFFTFSRKITKSPSRNDGAFSWLGARVSRRAMSTAPCGQMGTMAKPSMITGGPAATTCWPTEISPTSCQEVGDANMLPDALTTHSVPSAIDTSPTASFEESAEADSAVGGGAVGGTGTFASSRSLPGHAGDSLEGGRGASTGGGGGGSGASSAISDGGCGAACDGAGSVAPPALLLAGSLAWISRSGSSSSPMPPP